MTLINCGMEDCRWNSDGTCGLDEVTLFDSKDMWDNCKPSVVCDNYETDE